MMIGLNIVFLWSSRNIPGGSKTPHLSTRHYARIVRGWVRETGSDARHVYVTPRAYLTDMKQSRAGT